MVQGSSVRALGAIVGRRALAEARAHARSVAQPPSGRSSLGAWTHQRMGATTDSCATLSHMEIGVRDLRNRTTQVIDAVRAGNRVTLTVRGEPVADIVPHGRRVRWLSGAQMREQLERRAADPALTDELEAVAGQTLDEI
jgi:prevent-host-death family protein